MEPDSTPLKRHFPQRPLASRHLQGARNPDEVRHILKVQITTATGIDVEIAIPRRLRDHDKALAQLMRMVVLTANEAFEGNHKALRDLIENVARAATSAQKSGNPRRIHVETEARG